MPHMVHMVWEDVPVWLPGWCAEQLGSAPERLLFGRRSLSAVFGLRLTDGRAVVVKAKEDDGRAASCVTAQLRPAERGFPCARPLTPVTRVGTLAVHAEESRPGGEVLPGDSPEVAARCAAVFAQLMSELATITVASPLPNPRWARWDHTDTGVWPAIPFLDRRDQRAVPAHITDTAGRPCALGHADFEAQNLRWRDGQMWAVHDWDSLAWQPEAALTGAARVRQRLTPDPGPGREFRRVPGDVPGAAGTAVQRRGARDRLGGEPVAGGAQRPMGGPARRPAGGLRSGPGPGGRTPPPGERLTARIAHDDPHPQRRWPAAPFTGTVARRGR
ncbi:hypothetical protein GCM10010417_28290 [Streptomyces carpaticus]